MRVVFCLRIYGPLECGFKSRRVVKFWGLRAYIAFSGMFLLMVVIVGYLEEQNDIDGNYHNMLGKERGHAFVKCLQQGRLSVVLRFSDQKRIFPSPINFWHICRLSFSFARYTLCLQPAILHLFLR